ncbi:transcriptional regulator, TetR family [Aneurinibacillus aneurinilyticus ATCC 12856]|uniref:Transcriptional regulator, TetR family n=2 Tax=Aneurinibacillus aneurinilyticus TaxID=1391 RepID=U1YF34_ANEAE|nr:transcriptional regulator, TetR family [Aneurinibacillus aneurinilyticus ATCC 12856]
MVINMNKQDKRQRIIDAAYQVIAEKGYEKSSIKDIAHVAAVAPGLVHYYFTSKEEILSVLLMEASRQYTRHMENIHATVDSEQLPEAVLSEPKNRVEKQPDWYKLRYEFFAMGLRNSSIKPAVNELLENGRQGISYILQNVLENQEHDIESMSAVLLACFDGLALQKLLNPDFDLESAYHVLEQMIRSLEKNRE